MPEHLVTACSTHITRQASICNSFKPAIPYSLFWLQVLSEEPLFALASVDLLELDAPCPHIARFLPSIRQTHPLLASCYRFSLPATHLPACSCLTQAVVLFFFANMHILAH